MIDNYNDDITFIENTVPWYKKLWSKIIDIYKYIKKFFDFLNNFL